MSPGNGDWVAGPNEDPLDDETVEQLLAGRYSGGARELVALAQALDAMRAVADEPPPAPSAALQALLAGERPPAAAEPTPGPWQPPARPDPWATRPLSVPSGPEEVPRRRKFRWLPVGGIAAAVAALGLTTAASAGVLPAPAQRIVATVVRTVTPFEVPEPARENTAARSSSPATSAVPPARSPAPSRSEGSRPATTAAPPPSTGGAAGSASASTSVVPTTSASSPTNPTGASPSPPGGDEGGPGPRSTPPPRPQLTATLSGKDVRPKAGDPDGSGTASVTLDASQSRICAQLSLSGIAPPTAVHVHSGASGKVGAVVATLPPPPDPGTPSCATLDQDVLGKLRSHPDDYYIEVHNAEFPDGAARGELRKS